MQENQNPQENLNPQENDKKSKKLTLTKEEKSIVDAANGLFKENQSIDKLLVTEDGQAFFEKNAMYALRHSKHNKLKLYKVSKSGDIEEVKPE